MDTETALSLPRLFADPSLNGSVPVSPGFSPDGSEVAFLQGSDDEQLRYDLWAWNVATGTRRKMVAADALAAAEDSLSDIERARRERMRIAALSGIVSYQYKPDGSALLIPSGGTWYLADTKTGQARALALGDGAIIDAKFSPDGRHIGYVRDGDLHIYDLASGTYSALTTSATALVRNGEAEFIAQEEMGRYTGFWWSPDGQSIAFLETDSSPVAITERYEIFADDVRTVRQRYPATGTANASVRLGVVRITDGAIRWLDIGGEADQYVARVDWFPAADALAVQRQTRNQQRLDLLHIDVTSGARHTLLSEISDTWVNLYDDLTFVPERDAFLWTSMRDGYKHIYLYGLDGELRRQLTKGPWEVTGERAGRAIKHVDSQRGIVYFMATLESPTERHLYATSLDAADNDQPTRLTDGRGWHDVAVSASGETLLDSFSNTETPPQLRLQGVDSSDFTQVAANALAPGHPYYPYAERHAPAEFGVLEAADGQALHYYLRRPKGAPDEAHPAIVIVYGGPHGQRVRNAWGDLVEQVMVERGYVVFSLDNHGTSFRGSAFDDPIFHDLGRVEVADQRIGVEFLAAQPFVDAERIGVFGWSYGGYMVLKCLTEDPTLFAAGVSGAPVTDWALYDTHYTERYLDTPVANADAYAAAGVFGKLSALDAPLLLMHGMADDNVLFSHSTRLLTALQAQQSVFELMTYPGAKHALLRDPDDGLHAWRTILDFFDRHLAAQ